MVSFRALGGASSGGTGSRRPSSLVLRRGCDQGDQGSIVRPMPSARRPR
ncbi:hypothetical protein W824_07020 [Clavibacter cf. michiganensis LMG 26808]|nr:hypothetical protein W824_07020 [Clavibacter cf. michiganensis LMG 26808]